MLLFVPRTEDEHGDKEDASEHFSKANNRDRA